MNSDKWSILWEIINRQGFFFARNLDKVVFWQLLWDRMVHIRKQTLRGSQKGNKRQRFSHLSRRQKISCLYFSMKKFMNEHTISRYRERPNWKKVLLDLMRRTDLLAKYFWWLLQLVLLWIKLLWLTANHFKLTKGFRKSIAKLLKYPMWWSHHFPSLLNPLGWGLFRVKHGSDPNQGSDYIAFLFLSLLVSKDTLSSSVIIRWRIKIYTEAENVPLISTIFERIAINNYFLHCHGVIFWFRVSTC